MHARRADPAAAGIQVRELGEGAGGGVVIKLRERDDLVVVVGSVGPVEVACVGAGPAIRVDVVEPRVVCFGEGLEEGAVGELVVVEAFVVEAVAV